MLPVIHKLSCLQSKGCGSFYKTLCNPKIISGDIGLAEIKWHTELGTVLSTDCWNQIWKLTKNKLVDNRTKWLQIQINQFVLPTNYTVSKYRFSQSPWCSFCHYQGHLERLPSLFWDCPTVKQFWMTVCTFLSNFIPTVVLGQKEALFGDINHKPESMVNTIIALSRLFIWKQKFATKQLDEAEYFKFLERELIMAYTVLNAKQVPENIDIQWALLFDFFEFLPGKDISYL